MAGPATRYDGSARRPSVLPTGSTIAVRGDGSRWLDLERETAAAANGKKICHALSVSVFAARHRGFGRCFVFWNDQLIRSVRLPERSFRDGGKLEHVSFVDG